MSEMLCADTAEAFLADGSIPDGFDSVASLLDDLRVLLEGPAPHPSAALALLLDGTGPVAVSDLAARRTRRAAGLGVTAALVGLVTLGSAGVAAANGRLPKATQDAVADAIEAVTPFTVPHHRPSDRHVSPADSPPTAVGTVSRVVARPRPAEPGGSTAAGTRDNESATVAGSQPAGGRKDGSGPERATTDVGSETPTSETAGVGRSGVGGSNEAGGQPAGPSGGADGHGATDERSGGSVASSAPGSSGGSSSATGLSPAGEAAPSEGSASSGSAGSSDGSGAAGPGTSTGPGTSGGSGTSGSSGTSAGPGTSGGSSGANLLDTDPSSGGGFVAPG